MASSSLICPACQPRAACETASVFSGLGIAPLVLIFGAAAAAVWVAGIQLSSSTDALDIRLGLGEALGGAVLLAIATNLPEIAITASAALAHDLGIAIGNILGGIAIQTVVLVVLDVAMGQESALTTRAASLVLGLEGLLVVARARDLGHGCAAAGGASVRASRAGRAPDRDLPGSSASGSSTEPAAACPGTTLRAPRPEPRRSRGATPRPSRPRR